MKPFFILLLTGVLILLTFNSSAQSYATWYKNAQERIDTLRKGSFGIKILDKDGQPYSGSVSVRMAKHEFPFGIAFDFSEGSVSMGSSYSTSATVQASADAEIYQSERWSNYLAYVLPVESGREYKLTLKFAEIYLSTNNSRLFDVTVDGQLFLDNYDVHAAAGGKNIAVDTSVSLTPTNNYISLELRASKDNASIKGIVLEEVGGGNVIRINCGGNTLITSNGNQYVSEEGYFDPDVNTVASKEQWMKAAMYKYFNYGVSGNSFKWSGIQAQHVAPNYKNFDNAVRWTQKVGWELRAHTLLWGGYEYTSDHEMPRWVKDLPTPQAFTDTCKMRVIREVSRYKGIIKEYDVMNEPVHATYTSSVVGDSINWNCFKWARSADPDAELYINEYNVEFNWGNAIKYRDLILKIKAMGGPVTGVGMQAHFWDCCRPNVDELVKNINIVAEAGLPIKLTEYDYGGNLTQADQASDFIKVLTVAFSHPSINGLVSWGLSDDGAWRENTGFFDANHKPKLAADTLLYYTKTKWATNFDTLMASGDVLFFDAYYGNYTIEVEFNDTVKIFTLPCLKANSDSVFTLYEKDAVLKGPKLIGTTLTGPKQISLLFDKPIGTGTLKRSDFKFHAIKKIGITSALVDESNPNVVDITLDVNVTPGDYISISYFPGNLAATDNSKARAFGPEPVPNPGPPVGIHQVNGGSFTVYPNPAYDNISIVSQSAPFSLAVFNVLGKQVYQGNSDSENLNLDVSGFDRGLYLIRITGSNNKISVRKILLN